MQWCKSPQEKGACVELWNLTNVQFIFRVTYKSFRLQSHKRSDILWRLQQNSSHARMDATATCGMHRLEKKWKKGKRGYVHTQVKWALRMNKNSKKGVCVGHTRVRCGFAPSRSLWWSLTGRRARWDRGLPSQLRWWHQQRGTCHHWCGNVCAGHVSLVYNNFSRERYIDRDGERSTCHGEGTCIGCVSFVT